MKLNRNAFVNKLEMVFPAVGVTTLIQEYQYFQFKGKTLQATDGTLMIHAKLPEDTGLECGIHAAPFLTLLKSLTTEEIEIVCTGKDIIIKAEGMKGILFVREEPKIKDIEFPQTVYEDKEKIVNLVEGLRFCKFGVSKDETLGPLCGVRLDEDFLLSSDRYRVTQWFLKGCFDGLRCTLPLKLIDAMIKNRDKISKIGYDSGNLESPFTVLLEDGTCILSTTLQGEYHNLLQYFPAPDSSCVEVDFAHGLYNELERHIKFLSHADSIDKEVNIEICKNECTVTSKDDREGILTEVLETTNSVDSKVSFDVNPIFLRDIANACSSFKYFAEMKIILVEGGNFRYLIQGRI